jgi:cytochrome P450
VEHCRRETPVLKVTSPIAAQNGYLVTRAADIVAVTRDPTTFSSIGNPQSDRWGDYNNEVAQIFRSEGWPLSRVLVWIDSPEHNLFRKLVDKMFLPNRVTAREGHIRVCIDALTGRLPDEGRIDGVADFAASLPAMVMTREFNASENDFRLLIDTTNAIGHSIDFTRDDPADADRLVAEAARAICRFQHYMMPRIEAVRARPTNTLLSELVNAVDKEGRPALTVEQLHSILIIFLIAATHSTTGGIAGAFYVLAEQQELQARLRREPDKIGDFVEEVLRHHATVQTSYRTAACNTKVGGVDVPAGSQLFLRWDSANFDENKWVDPERFDIDRKGIRNHMTFGFGGHACVGNTLARREMALGVSALLSRYARIALAAEPERLESFGIHALNTLPLTVSQG